MGKHQNLYFSGILKENRLKIKVFLIVIILIFSAFLGAFSALATTKTEIPTQETISKKPLLPPILANEKADKTTDDAEIKAIDSLPQEKLEITTKNNRLIVKTQISRLDLRPIIESFINPKNKYKVPKKSKLPRINQKPFEEKKGTQQILDIYLSINEIILPKEVRVRDVNSFMVYHYDNADKSNEGMLALIEGLSSNFNTDLLFQIKQLNFSGKLIGKKKISDLQISLATVNDKMKTILVSSTDPNTMMKILGLDVFEGKDYVFHADWKKHEGDWSIDGTIEMKNVFVTSPPLTARLLSGLLSFKGLLNSVTSNKIFFKKLELSFVVKNGKRKFVCKTYFGENVEVPCGSF